MDMMAPPPQAGPADDEEGSGIVRSRSRWRGTAVSVLLFAISLIVLWQILSQVKFEDVTGAFAGKAREQLALAFFFTVVSYTLLTGYDALALHQMRARIPYRTTALASFTSYAISFTLGFPLFTAGAVRYWIYAPRGLPASKVAGLTLIAGSTFLLGMGAVVGFGLVFRAEALAEINRLAVSVNRLIGLAVLGAITAYIVYSFLGRRRASASRSARSCSASATSAARRRFSTCCSPRGTPWTSAPSRPSSRSPASSAWSATPPGGSASSRRRSCWPSGGCPTRA
jgi:uncharacterized membrane protein YbhN (UPF0104 family)